MRWRSPPTLSLPPETVLTAPESSVEPASPPDGSHPPVAAPKHRRRKLRLILGVGGGILLGGMIIGVVLPASVSCSAGKAHSVQGRFQLGAMNRAQQAFYLDHGHFASRIEQLDLGFPPRTRYYHYQLQAHAFSRGSSPMPLPGVIQTATVQPTPDQTWSLVNLNPVTVRSLAGAVIANPAPGADSGSTLTLLCQAIEPGPQAIAPPVYRDGQLQCGPGSNPL